MTAFFIATVKVKDKEKLQSYIQQATETIGDYEGEPVIKGMFDGTLNDKQTETHQMAGIFKFPSLEKMEEWYNSDKYQALIPLREEGADMTLSKYVVPEA